MNKYIVIVDGFAYVVEAYDSEYAISVISREYYGGNSDFNSVYVAKFDGDISYKTDDRYV